MIFDFWDSLVSPERIHFANKLQDKNMEIKEYKAPQAKVIEVNMQNVLA